MNDLVKTVVSQLGVSEGQAEGGLGLLLKAAQDHLPKEENAKLVEGVPDAAALMEKAPAEGGGGAGGMMGAAASALGGLMGGGAGQLGALASLAGGFSSLGLDKDQIVKFAGVAKGWLEQNDKADLAAMLGKLGV